MVVLVAQGRLGIEDPVIKGDDIVGSNFFAIVPALVVAHLHFDNGIADALEGFRQQRLELARAVVVADDVVEDRSGDEARLLFRIEDAVDHADGIEQADPQRILGFLREGRRGRDADDQT